MYVWTNVQNKYKSYYRVHSLLSFLPPCNIDMNTRLSKDSAPADTIMHSETYQTSKINTSSERLKNDMYCFTIGLSNL